MGKGFKICILLATFFVVTGSLVILAFLPSWVAGSVINTHISFQEIYDPAEYGIETEQFTLVSDDHYKLAVWELAVEEPHALVVFLGGLNHPPVSAFWGHARMLAKHGYGSLLIELRSHGESGGNQVYLGYAEHLDVLAGLQYLQRRYQGVPVVAFGADLGGVVAINAAGLYPELAGVISIGAFSSWSDLFRDNLYFSGAPLWVAMVEKPFVDLYTLAKFGYKNRHLYPQRQIANLDTRPALLMHSQDDEFVSVLNLERIMQRAPKQVETWIREGDEHLVSTEFRHPEQDPEYAERVVGFLDRHFR